jgi:hypothetical protein
MAVRRIVIASSTGNRNALVGGARCIKISFAEHFVVPACAYRVDTINYKDSFPALCRGARYFGAPKYPKRFVNPAMWLLTIPGSSKKQRQLFCSFLLNESLSDIFTKPLRFRFGSAICPIVQLFF